MGQDLEQFINDFSAELIAGSAAYFIGAGISTPSKLPGWISLLEPYARRIGIDDLNGKDLPAIAQYVINEEVGNKGPFINSISNRLRKKYAANNYHKHIARTNLKTIWTTNYDNLIEQSLIDQVVDIKVSDDDFLSELPDTKVELIKMHGCIFKSNRSDIVITQEDYEDFFIKKPATAQRLRADLLQKSFLFIGYGYQDPNIQNIIIEARRLARNSTRRHYLITKLDKKNDNETEFKHWATNLRRYGISVIVIDDYSQLEDILRKLSLRSRGKSVFITGSHQSKGSSEVEKIAKFLAEKNDVILNDGQSSGAMRLAVTTFMQKQIDEKIDIEKKIRIFPNPYASNHRFSNDPSLLPLLKQWRTPLLKATQILIAFDGGMGTIAEVERALELGCIIIPFFRDKKSPTFKLLEIQELIDCISQYDDSYLKKMKNGTPNYHDLHLLLEKVLTRY